MTREKIKDFFSFDGRSPRKEFWIILLATSLSMSLLGALAFFLSTRPKSVVMSILLVVVLLIFGVFAYLSIANEVRRWHDRGKSGWWFFIKSVPYIGSIWMLIECGFLPGDERSNRFGRGPQSR